MREIKFKAVMKRIDGAIYVSDGYGADSSFLSYLFDFEDNRWDRFLEGIITEQRFVKLFPDDDEDVKGWRHIENIQWTGLLDKNGKEIYKFMEIDGNFEVNFKDGCYVLINISNGDIILLYNYLKDKNGQVTVTKEYTKI